MHHLKRMIALQDTVMGINERNLRLVYPLNPREHFHLADDKVTTKRILEEHGIPVARQLLVIERIGDIDTQWREMPRVPCCVKPARGSGGGGILVMDPGEGATWLKGRKAVAPAVIRRHLGNILFGVFSFGSDDVVLVEEKIVPHHFFTDIYPAGVADLRVIVKEGETLMAMLRIPTDKSDGRANLHQGAVGVGVDLETGQLTEGYDGKRYHRVHPDSKRTLGGLSLPFWQTTRDICQRVFDAFPLDYLGIDIAYDESRGPLVLEINVRPGLQIQNVNRTGLKTRIT